MTFTVGETVVYPNHGAAVIENIETRQIKGEDRLYLVLRIVAQQDLVVRVPACNLDLVGVRDVVDKEGLERVFDVLRAPHVEEPTNWSRRYKANLEKLHSGDVMKVAEVVRTSGVVSATAASPQVRSGCSPRPGRSSSPSWRSPSTPTRTRPRLSSTRSSLPEQTVLKAPGATAPGAFWRPAAGWSSQTETKMRHPEDYLAPIRTIISMRHVDSGPRSGPFPPMAPSVREESARCSPR